MSDIKKALSIAPMQLYIDGEWRDASNGDTFDVDNPC